MIEVGVRDKPVGSSHEIPGMRAQIEPKFQFRDSPIALDRGACDGGGRVSELHVRGGIDPKTLRLFGAPNDGDWIALRGAVLDTYDKRGHVMTDIDLAMFADERVVAWIRHSAIIRLAGSE